MRIVIAHNAYQIRGGEDVVVDAEIDLLRRNGHDVTVYRRENNELKGSPATALQSVFWSKRSVLDMDQMVQAKRPDLIHVHNTFPLISPSLFWAASAHGIPVVQTLHNFRLLCPQAMFLRHGKVCEDCMGKVPWRAVTRKCYRDSFTQSAVLSTMLTTHMRMGTFHDKISLYIALTEFCREKFEAGGLPADRIRVKPNFVPDPGPPDKEPRSGGLFVGRLSLEKGVDVMIAVAKQLPDLVLQVVGEGPMQERVQRQLGDRYVGYVEHKKISAMMRRSLYVLAPSTAYETFGMVAIEAFACGTPVIASRHGSLGTLVEHGVTGLLVDPGDPSSLLRAIKWAEAHPEQMLAMGRNARAVYEQRYPQGTPGVEVFTAESEHLRTPDGVYESWSAYDYKRNTRETRVANSDPGQILSGGAMGIKADTVTNNKSRIIAGGTLTANIGKLTNAEVEGDRFITDTGTETSYWRVPLSPCPTAPPPKPWCPSCMCAYSRETCRPAVLWWPATMST